MNPVLVREVRSRWRGRSFVLILAHLVLLIGVVGWNYSSYDIGMLFNSGNPNRRMARAGHEMFLTISWMQTLFYVLLAPACTATSIASEREHGLLESLQLSPLAPWKIVWGKLLGTTLFLAMVLVASLPVLGVCFLMGGVSFEEFLVVALLQITTALSGAMLGLFCSSLSRRSNSAMGWTIALLLFWLLTSWIAFEIWQHNAPGTLSRLDEIRYSLVGLLGYSNPVIAVLATIDPQIFSGVAAPPFNIAAPPWVVCLLIQLTAGALFFRLATRAVRKPLAEPWSEPSKTQSRTQANVPNMRAAATFEYSNGASEKSDAPAKSDSRWDLSRLLRFHFSNAVLQRELCTRFRPRQLPLWNMAILGGVAAYLTFRYLYWLWGILIDPTPRRGAWMAVSSLSLMALMVAASVMGANSFARERESRTWDGLRMSLLSRREIIAGKMLSALLACLLYSIPLWLLFGIYLLKQNGASILPSAVTPLEEACALLLMTSTAWFCVAWGMFLSWRHRRIAVATAWTVGTLFFAFVFVPTILLMLFPDGPVAMPNGTWPVQYRTEIFLSLWHPFISFTSLDHSYLDVDTIQTAQRCALHLFAAGCLLLMLLYWEMRPEFVSRKLWNRPFNQNPKDIVPMRNHIESPELTSQK